mmetsp:Transcript_3981/g.8807  ORF Transcript_3981/g.8807 Transcript_3981/m.8807 type:complete len:217 (-) Transcript_3981:1243-1893(-)
MRVRWTMLERTLSCRVMVGSSALRRTAPRSSGLIMIGVSTSSSISVAIDVDVVVASSLELASTSSLLSLSGTRTNSLLSLSLVNRFSRDQNFKRRILPFSCAPLGSSSLTPSSSAVFSMLADCSPSSGFNFLANVLAVTIATVSDSYLGLNSSNDTERFAGSASYANLAAASYGIATGFSSSRTSLPFEFPDADETAPFFLSFAKAILSSIERQIS